MNAEFDLIRRYFSRPVAGTLLAGGDDCALLLPPEQQALAVTCDTLVAGTHFLPDDAPADVGWKTLAASVSDIAAMAARPRWATLALTLPEVRHDWLAAFAEGFYACADAYDVALVGGDTTRGPLAATVTLIGDVPQKRAVRRGGARAGDELWVSGQPGRAALGLQCVQGALELPFDARAQCLAALRRPQPRLALGRLLAVRATAMLDVSDGLLADLGHLLRASRLGAQLWQDALPLAALQQMGVSQAQAMQAVLAGGDDYELLFAAPASLHEEVRQAGKTLSLPLHCIGRCEAGETVRLRDGEGREMALEAFAGFEHFPAAQQEST